MVPIVIALVPTIVGAAMLIGLNNSGQKGALLFGLIICTCDPIYKLTAAFQPYIWSARLEVHCPRYMPITQVISVAIQRR